MKDGITGVSIWHMGIIGILTKILEFQALGNLVRAGELHEFQGYPRDLSSRGLGEQLGLLLVFT